MCHSCCLFRVDDGNYHGTATCSLAAAMSHGAACVCVRVVHVSLFSLLLIDFQTAATGGHSISLQLRGCFAQPVAELTLLALYCCNRLDCTGLFSLISISPRLGSRGKHPAAIWMRLRRRAAADLESRRAVFRSSTSLKGPWLLGSL